MSRPVTAVAIVFLYMVSFFPWLICIKNSISWRFRFECLVRILVCGHVIVLWVRGDTVDEIITRLAISRRPLIDTDNRQALAGRGDGLGLYLRVLCEAFRIRDYA